MGRRLRILRPWLVKSAARWRLKTVSGCNMRLTIPEPRRHQAGGATLQRQLKMRLAPERSTSSRPSQHQVQSSGGKSRSPVAIAESGENRKPSVGKGVYMGSIREAAFIALFVLIPWIA